MLKNTSLQFSSNSNSTYSKQQKTFKFNNFYNKRDFKKVPVNNIKFKRSFDTRNLFYLKKKINISPTFKQLSARKQLLLRLFFKLHKIKKIIFVYQTFDKFKTIKRIKSLVNNVLYGNTSVQNILGSNIKNYNNNTLVVFLWFQKLLMEFKQSSFLKNTLKFFYLVQLSNRFLWLLKKYKKLKNFFFVKKQRYQKLILPFFKNLKKICIKKHTSGFKHLVINRFNLNSHNLKQNKSIRAKTIFSFIKKYNKKILFKNQLLQYKKFKNYKKQFFNYIRKNFLPYYLRNKKYSYKLYNLQKRTKRLLKKKYIKLFFFNLLNFELETNLMLKNTLKEFKYNYMSYKYLVKTCISNYSRFYSEWRKNILFSKIRSQESWPIPQKLTKFMIFLFFNQNWIDASLQEEVLKFKKLTIFDTFEKKPTYILPKFFPVIVQLYLFESILII